ELQGWRSEAWRWGAHQSELAACAERAQPVKNVLGAAKRGFRIREIFPGDLEAISAHVFRDMERIDVGDFVADHYRYAVHEFRQRRQLPQRSSFRKADRKHLDDLAALADHELARVPWNERLERQKKCSMQLRDEPIVECDPGAFILQ